MFRVVNVSKRCRDVMLAFAIQDWTFKAYFCLLSLASSRNVGHLTVDKFLGPVVQKPINLIQD